MATPVKKHDTVDVTIESLAFGGSGVARLNGYVIFVRKALPGDVVRAEVTKVRRGYAEATSIELLEPGPDRVEPRCSHAGTCGGCRFPELGYEAQVRAKQGPGSRRVRAHRAACRRTHRADGSVALPVRVPQQARVLVHAD